MARVNISIPDELRQRMGGLNCNWSAIAQEAFTHAVELEELRGAGRDMDAGLARLRVSKHGRVEREGALGFQHGMNWALEQASFDELREMVDTLSEELPEKVVAWVNAHRDATGLDGLGPPKSDVSVAYAQGYLQGAADVLAQV